MPNVLITGANRGLGLEFVRQYRAEGWEVIATARKTSPELEALGAEVRTLDMADFAAVADFTLDRPLDLLIANAGIALPSTARTAAEGEGWIEVLRVNTVAPTLLVQALMPRLSEAGGKAVAISSRMGSIAESSGGYLPYRSSKSALNMAWHGLALEAKAHGVTLALLNPGWVQTDMGGPGASIAPAESIGDLRRVIAGLDIGQSGSFLDRDGSQVPW